MKTLIKFLIILLLFSFLNTSFAQYQSIGPYGGYIQDLLTDNQGRVLAAAYLGGIFRTSNSGDSWEQIFALEYRLTDIRSLAVNSSGHIFAGTDASGLFRSTDDGLTWENLSNIISNEEIRDILIQSDGDIFVATLDGVFKSSDNGSTFTEASNGISTSIVYSLVEAGTYIFAGTGFAGIFRTSDEGLNWEAVNNGINNFQSEIVVAFGSLNSINKSTAGSPGDIGDILVGIGTELYTTSDFGDIWEELEFPVLKISDIIFKSNDTVIVSSTGSNVIEGKIVRSTNAGVNWDTMVVHKQPIICVTLDPDGKIYAGLPGAGVLGSDNTGLNWDLKNIGIAATNISAIWGSLDGGIIRVVTNEGQAHQSTDQGNSWKDETHNLLYTFANEKNSLAVSGISKTWFFATAYGTYRKPDNDDDWEPTGFTFKGVKADDVGNFYGWTARNLFKSTDDAINFNLLTSAPFTIDNIVFDKDNDILASTTDQFNLGNGIFKYEDDNWTPYNNGLTDLNVSSLKKLSVTASASYCTKEITCATENGKFFALNEEDDLWTEFSVGLQSTYNIKDIGGFYDLNNKYFTEVIDGGIHRLDQDNCAFWSVNFPDGYELTKGLYWSPPGGAMGKVMQDVIAFYGTTGGGILRSDLSVGVKEIQTPVPTEFNLKQNYPNPFNPTTTIQFAIPHQSFVQLEIFNALGERVSTLISEFLSAGTYEYKWNAGLPSGVYLYRLSTENFVQAKKLLLMK